MYLPSLFAFSNIVAEKGNFVAAKILQNKYKTPPKGRGKAYFLEFSMIFAEPFKDAEEMEEEQR